MGCVAKALQRSLPDEAYRRARTLAVKFDEPIALPNGRDAPHDLGSAANAF